VEQERLEGWKTRWRIEQSLPPHPALSPRERDHPTKLGVNESAGYSSENGEESKLLVLRAESLKLLRAEWAIRKIIVVCVFGTDSKD
jgi:hypothetical protein